ncbi:MAG: hypothetical protein HQK54_17885 [Oligoflexales bacterium]|nr:hypothetical protein [Oligoflexales bacterium]
MILVETKKFYAAKAWSCLLTALFLSCFFSAGARAAEENELISKYKKLAHANKVVQKINYLPFSAITGGCYARSLYMGMELTVKKIPVNNQYIFGKLRPQGANWRWHVAPIYKISDDEAYALDPSFSKQPIELESWVKLTNPKEKPSLGLSPISHYRRKSSFIQQQSMKKAPGYSWDTIGDGLDDIPEYNIKNIADACQTAWSYIGLEKIPEREKEKKREYLEKRTNYLVDMLIKMNKLSEGAKIEECETGTYSGTL